MSAAALLAAYLRRLALDPAWPVAPIVAHPSTASATFIDGGSGPLLDSASAALHLIRIAHLGFSGTRRTQSRLEEYTVLATATAAGVTIELEPAHPRIPAAFAWKELGDRRPAVPDFAQYVRRLLELAACAETEGLAVLDGTLDGQGATEQRLLADLWPRRVLGIAKTHTLLDDYGAPIAALAARRPGTWLLGPVSQQPVKTYAAKLHGRGHVVRLDARHPPAPAELALLAAHARDPTFLGYPWGLLAADLAARVARTDSAYYATKLEMSLGGQAGLYADLAATQNAHALLDRLAHRHR